MPQEIENLQSQLDTWESFFEMTFKSSLMQAALSTLTAQDTNNE